MQRTERATIPVTIKKIKKIRVVNTNKKYAEDEETTDRISEKLTEKE